jgi:hypothetical protein
MSFFKSQICKGKSRKNLTCYLQGSGPGACVTATSAAAVIIPTDVGNMGEANFFFYSLKCNEIIIIRNTS